MARKFRAQVEPISAVIMTGIVVSLVGIAYFWGVPLIQKRASMTEFEAMERFISNLRDKINELARSGAGEVNLEIKDAFVKLVPYKDPASPDGRGNNSLVIEFVVDQPLMFPNTTLYLGATSFEDISSTGTYGEASPSVVKLSSSQLGVQYKMTAEVSYRDLLKETAPKKVYIIALCGYGDPDCKTIKTGNSMITMSFDKNNLKYGEASNGGDLVETYIKLRLA